MRHQSGLEQQLLDFEKALRGVFASATWGRCIGLGDDAVTQRQRYSFRTAGDAEFG